MRQLIDTSLSLPQFLIFSLTKIFEIPVRGYMFWSQYTNSACSDGSELKLINRFAISLIQHGKAFVNDDFALFDSFTRVPLIGNEGMSKIFRESYSSIIFGNMVAVKINAGKMSFSILISCNYEIIIIWVLFISLLVTQFLKIIGIITNSMLDSIIKQKGLMTKLSQFAGCLLEISILTCRSDNHIVLNLLISIDASVFQSKIAQYSRDLHTIAEYPLQQQHPLCISKRSLRLLSLWDLQRDLLGCLISNVQQAFKYFLKYQIIKLGIKLYSYPINIFIMQSRAKRGYSSHQGNVNKSFRIGGSLAEENQVRSFNKQRNNRSMAPSQPHRIQLPLFFNTPSRTFEEHSILNKTVQDESKKIQQKVDNATHITVMRRLKDYEMLAFGCRRAGKVRDQGRSYYSIGVLYDNIKKHQKAIEYYLKFLQVCKSINDSHGQALAYNCIGVDYQLLGQANPQFTKKAIEYHNLHETLADVNGKFLASINLGLCHDRLGDSKNSIYYFQNALKHSIQMSNLNGQSVAMGNIGKIGTKDLSENKDKMKLFVEKYLKLSAEMKDQKGQMEGCLKLGMISSTKKNFQQGKDNFKRALQLAEQTNNTEVYNQAKFGYAVVAAEKGMNNFLGYYSSKLNRKGDY